MGTYSPLLPSLFSPLPLGEGPGVRVFGSSSVPTHYPLTLTLSPTGERGHSVPEQESIA